MLITFMFILSSCVAENNTLKLTGFDENYWTGKALAKVTSVSVINDQLILNGTDLSGVKLIQITGSGFNETFSIESKNSNQLIANSKRAVSFAVSGIFSLIVSDVYGAATFPVTFELTDGSVTSAKINDMGAGEGEVLQFSGGSWGPAAIADSGLSFKASFDASLVATDQTTVAEDDGHFYVVTTAGSNDPDGSDTGTSWNAGDWAVYDSSATPVWKKIPGTNTITSVHGRFGDVVAQADDYDFSMIASGAGIYLNYMPNNVTCTPGQVLKWNNSRWECDDDLGVSSVGTSEISDGSIENADISGSAAIDQSKIDGLTAIVTTVGSNTISIAGKQASNTNLDDLADGTLSAASVEHNEFFITSAGTNGQVWTSDGTDAGSWQNPTVGTVTSVDVLAPVLKTGSATVPVISMAQADGSTDGYLAQADFAIFSGKQDALPTGGTPTQYLKGDYTLSTFNDDVAGAVLTGFLAAGNSVVINSDSVEVATEKLQGQINASNTLIAALPSLGTASGDAVDIGTIPECIATEKLQMSAGPTFTWTCVTDTTIADTNTQLSEATVEGFISNDVTSNYVPRSNGTKLVTGVIFDDGTDVGIGKAAGYKLDVNGTVNAPEFRVNGTVLTSGIQGQVTVSATEGSGCSDIGMLAKDASGNLLVCDDSPTVLTTTDCSALGVGSVTFDIYGEMYVCAN